MTNDQATTNNSSPEKLPEPPAENGHQYSIHSKTFKWAVFIIAGFIMLIGAFTLGIRVGFHEAHFTETWEKGYSANFGVPGDMPIKRSPQDPFLNAYGISGTILTVNGNNLTLKDSDNTEKVVVMSAGTSIRLNFSTLKPADLKTNQSIIVIGQPNEQGQIDAKFIRILNQP
jgi:hypothetical protein